VTPPSSACSTTVSVAFAMLSGLLRAFVKDAVLYAMGRWVDSFTGRNRIGRD
jgi:membrane protein DedA with SNARE-associated domain